MTTEPTITESPEETRAKLAIEIEDGLLHFTGGDVLYQHWLRCLRYTEGVKYLADKAGAHWLIDVVASYQPDKRVRLNQRLQEFQLWILRRSDVDDSCTVACFEDSSEPPVLSQNIPYTDFPLREIKLYVENGVLLLPSEH